MIENNILNDSGIHIKHNFFSSDILKSINDTFDKKDFKETYQPEEIFYGNRYQAYPCYQKRDNDIIFNYIKSYIENIVKKKFELLVVMRKVYSEELLKSKVNTKYGLKHKDGSDLAGVISLDHTVDGGTAFYYNQCDNYPDIEIGSWPNRMILYKGNRWHSSCHDFSYKVRKNICFFIDYK